MNKSIYEMTDSEIEILISSNLSINENKKKKNGEVFTPYSLINEMCNKLPLEVWSNPDYKWLDPCCGTGHFFMVIYNRLFDGLKDVIKDQDERRNHIINNMLYMIELNDENYNICVSHYGGNANIFCGSFLEDEWKKEFNVERFDVIVGNPPYNKNGVAKGGSVFWKKFVFSSIDVLNTDGYLTLVHPKGWRKPIGKWASAGDVFEKFKQGNLIYLNLNDEKIKSFPTVDYYVWKKSNDYVSTEYYCKYEKEVFKGNAHLQDLPFIPNLLNETVINIFIKLFKVEKQTKFNIVNNQSFKPRKCDIIKDPGTGIPHAFYYVPDDNKYIEAFKMYDNIPEYISKKKVIITNKAGKKKALLYPMYDDGMMGTSRNTMYQIVENIQEGKSLIKYFNSQLIRFLLKITQYSEPPNYANEIKILNLLDKPNGVIENDDDVFTLYDLNENEVSLILRHL